MHLWHEITDPTHNPALALISKM